MVQTLSRQLHAKCPIFPQLKQARSARCGLILHLSMTTHPLNGPPLPLFICLRSTSMGTGVLLNLQGTLLELNWPFCQFPWNDQFCCCCCCCCCCGGWKGTLRTVRPNPLCLRMSSTACLALVVSIAFCHKKQ